VHLHAPTGPLARGRTLAAEHAAAAAQHAACCAEARAAQAAADAAQRSEQAATVMGQLVAAAAQQAEHCRLAAGLLPLEEWRRQDAALIVAGTAEAAHAAVRRAALCLMRTVAAYQ